MNPLCLSLVDGGVHVFLRVTPKSSRQAIIGVVEVENNRHALKICVSAVPENGKANEAALQLLAKAWRLPQSPMRILSGHTHRHKTVLISGDAQALYEHILPFLKTLPQPSEL
jgi:uncharacterized protein (TIGR00251 family)